MSRLKIILLLLLSSNLLGQTDSISIIQTSSMFGRWVTYKDSLENSVGSPPTAGQDVYIVHRKAGIATHEDGTSAVGDSMRWEASLTGNPPSYTTSASLNDSSVIQFIEASQECISFDLDGDGTVTDGDTLWQFLEDVSGLFFVNFLMEFATPASGSRALWFSRPGNWGVASSAGLRFIIQSDHTVEVRNSNGTSYLASISSSPTTYLGTSWHSISIWSEGDSLHFSVDDDKYSQVWSGSDYSTSNLYPVIPNDLSGGTWYTFKFREMTVWKDYCLTECERKLLYHYQNVMYGLSIPNATLADVSGCLPVDASIPHKQAVYSSYPQK